MSLLDRLRLTLLACALLGLLAYAIAEQALLGVVVLAPFAGAGWWVTEGRRIRFGARWRSEDGAAPVRAAGGVRSWSGLPRWITNVVLAGILLAAIWRGVQGESVVSAFVAFLASILVLKLWEQREPRDYGQILTMSLFLTVGATLNDNSLGVGLVMIAQTVLLVWATMLYQLVQARVRAESAVASQKAGREVDFAHLAPALSDGRDYRAVRRPLAITFVGAMLVAGVIATTVFVLTPRGLGARPLGEFARPLIARTSGFADRVDLNQGGFISQSPSIIMDVRVQSALDRTPAGSDDDPLYLRGVVLDEYSEGRWGVSRESASRADFRLVDSGQLRRLEPVRSVHVTRQLVRVRDAGAGVQPVFHNGLATAVEFSGGSVELSMDTVTRTMLYSRRSRGRITYEVDATDAPLLQAPTRRGEVTYAQPSVRALTEEVLRDNGIEPDPAERTWQADGRAVRALESFLRSNFTYSLSPPRPPLGEDPTAWFLRERPAAHCEFYASALAAMSRSVGIDARVIAGYLTTEFDEEEGAYLVRAQDAHAWVEVQVAPGRWEVFDGTPLASPLYRVERREGLWARFTRTLAGVENFWNASIVSFDDSTQRRVLGFQPGRASWIERQVRRALPAGLDLPERARGLGRTASGALTGVLALALLVGGALLLRAAWKRTGAGARDAKSPGWALAEQRLALTLRERVARELARAGVPQPAHVPLLRHLESLCEDGADADARARLAERLRPAAEALYDFRFAGHADAGRLRSALRDLGRPGA